MSLLQKSTLETKCSANVVKGMSLFSSSGGNSCYANFDDKHNDTGWIVDTRATHHTYFDLNRLAIALKLNLLVLIYLMGIL